MRRGTTPTHTFILPFDTGQVKSVRIVYAQADKVVLVKITDNCTLEGNTVTCKLSQKDTLGFDDMKNVNIQLRVLLHDGTALASDIETVFVSSCLDDEVIE
jgi:hypothetical protein